MTLFSGIYRDKTMADKLMYIPDDNTQITHPLYYNKRQLEEGGVEFDNPISYLNLRKSKKKYFRGGNFFFFLNKFGGGVFFIFWGVGGVLPPKK